MMNQQRKCNMKNRNITPAVEPVKKTSGNRRCNKSMMEKRRRARMNNCYNELLTCILRTSEKQSAQHSKLEKAEILEKTVNYIQHLKRQQSATSNAADPTTVNKFKAGFTECTKEIEKFHELEPVEKSLLVQHLSNHFSDNRTGAELQNEPIQHHIPPSLPGSSPDHNQDERIFQLTPSNGCYVKLPNGILTYVIPQPLQHIPQVIIPARMSSVAAIQSQFERLSCESIRQSHACSYASSLSPTNSIDFMNYQMTPTFNYRPNTMQTQQHSFMQPNFIYHNDLLAQDIGHWS